MSRLFYESIEIGSLHENEDLGLSYGGSWLAKPSAFPLSMTMPLRKDVYGADRLLPWLSNLLPETHLSEIGQRLKVSPQDVVGLLRHIGRDTAGAISFDLPRKPGTHVKWLDDEKTLERIVDELPEKPFLVGERGVSMSLAGVQEKLPVCVDADGRIGIPVDGTPSTHILKPNAEGKRLAGSVQNEAFCMTLARRCGLDVSEVTTGKAGGRSYLLVKRYDRVLDSEGTARRIHQEDFCQLLGYFPSQKYERSTIGGRNGPTLPDMFKATETHVSPGARTALLDAVVINVLLCNTDAHAKNYSILIGRGGTTKLAPLYDLMCAAVYKHVDQHLAQSVAGRTNANDLHGAHWAALAKSVGLSPAATLKRVGELSAAVIAHVDDVVREVGAMPAGGCDLLGNIVHQVRKRAVKIGKNLENAGTRLENAVEEEAGYPHP